MPSWTCDELTNTMWRLDRVMSWSYDELTGSHNNSISCYCYLILYSMQATPWYSSNTIEDENKMQSYQAHASDSTTWSLHQWKWVPGVTEMLHETKQCSKWFGKTPHRHLVTPRGGYPLNSAPSRGESRPPSNRWFLGTIWPSPPNGISIDPAVCAQLTCVPNTQTHRGVVANRLHLCIACRWCSLKIERLKRKKMCKIQWSYAADRARAGDING